MKPRPRVKPTGLHDLPRHARDITGLAKTQYGILCRRKPNIIHVEKAPSPEADAFPGDSCAVPPASPGEAHGGESVESRIFGGLPETGAPPLRSGHKCGGPDLFHDTRIRSARDPKRRMALLWRRLWQHKVLPAGPDQREEREGSAHRLALEVRELWRATGFQLGSHPLMVKGTLYLRRPERGGTWLR